MVFRMDSGNASCLCIRDHLPPWRLSTLKRVKPVKKKANDPYYRKTVCGNGQAPVKGAFLRDGDSAGRMYVLGPVTVCRQDQHA